MRTSSLAIVISAVLATTAAYSQSADTSVLKLPQDIEFKAAPVQGAPQTAVLYGDPTKPGVFVTRVKFSAGWKDQPHWHPDEVRTVAVLSGTFYFASGKRGTKASSRLIPPGHFTPSPQRRRTSHGRKTVR